MATAVAAVAVAAVGAVAFTNGNLPSYVSIEFIQSCGAYNRFLHSQLEFHLLSVASGSEWVLSDVSANRIKRTAKVFLALRIRTIKTVTNERMKNEKTKEKETRPDTRHKMRLVCVLFTFENNAGPTDLRTDGPTDGPTDGRTDRRTDGRMNLLKEMRKRIS